MYLVTAFLLALRQMMKLGELSPELTGWLLGGGLCLIGLWIAAERLLEIVPGHFFCAVCGERIRHIEVLRNLRTAEQRSYPFRLPDGSRTELSVKALCRSCSRRARKHRNPGPGEM